MLRVAYLLTGSSVWSIDLVERTLLGVFDAINRGKLEDDFEHLALRELVREWREQISASWDSPERPARNTDPRPDIDRNPARERLRKTLARLDDHQRAVVAVHLFGGLPVDQLGDALDLSSELVYAQSVRSRKLLISAVELGGPDELPALLNAVAIDAPRLAIWPEIQGDVERRFMARARRERFISVGVVAAVIGILALGVFLIAGRSAPGDRVPTPEFGLASVSTPTQGAAFSLLPTATSTPMADVGDTIVLSSRETESSRTWLFENRLDDIPLLGADTLEAGVPVVAPDGRQVVLLWYAFEGERATGYVGAFDSDLSREIWRAAVGTDDEVPAGERVDFRMSVAVDHERVYVGVQPWRSSDLVEIDVLSREDGSLLETIPTNLTGFAAHDIRLHAPPGSNRVSLFAITSDAPPESGGLQITFLSYAVPGGEKVHGRILFDQPDSRTFFLYESRLIAGTETLFGVEHTQHYHQLAVHLFDLGQGSLEPRRVIPFQQVADPLPYQQVVSHDGHWLFILSPASLEVAVFNLFDKALAGIVPLDPGVLSDDEIGVSYPTGRAMQISPDGRRIYAEGTLGGSSSGIWVIDAASWTIVDHWLPETRTAELLLSGDGRTLYARVADEAGSAGSETTLLAIDTATGLAQPLDMPVVDRISLESIATLFQRTYGSSPAIEGQVPGSTISSEPLAAAQLNISRSDTNPGSMVTLDVRFVHPITGDPVDPSPGGARFQPPDSIRATWTPEDGGPATILTLGLLGYGHYQGLIQLDDPGFWSLRVDVDWPDGTLPDRTMILEDAITVIPAVTADGSQDDDVPSG